MPPEDSKPPKATQPVQVSLMRGKRPARIVLCDDESFLREMMVMVIGMGFKDYELAQCSDGDQAWREICRQAPDLLITDSAHTGMHVQEMLHRLYRTSRFFPVLVCSGSLGLSCSRERLSGFTLFPVLLLDKPFTVQDFHSKIQEAMDVKERPKDGQVGRTSS
jgi:CheY-like chemotaxis protein